MFDFMRLGGFNMWILMVLGLVTVWTAIQFARGADPQRLSILRALTIVLIVAAFTGFFAGLIATCTHVGHDPDKLVERLPLVVVGFGESCENLVFGGAFVVITWILIAVGVRRMPADPA